jgi:hypothetical protein
MTYVEFPFDRILSLHVKKAGEPPGNGHPPVPGLCGSGTWQVAGFPLYLYVTLGAPSYPELAGTYISVNPCCPPLPAGYDQATNTWPADPQDSLFIPGNGATSVTITWYANFKYSDNPQVDIAAWVFPKSGARFDGTEVPAAVNGAPGAVTVTIPPVIRAVGDPVNMLGTTVVFGVIPFPPGRSATRTPVAFVTPGPDDQIFVEHACPPPPPHSLGTIGPQRGSGGYPPINFRGAQPRCSELG